MEILWAKGTAKLIKLQNRQLEPEQVMALVNGPPELPSRPQYSPQEKDKAEIWGY